MHGFHDKFDAIKDVPVARSTMAYADQQGDTHILIVNEALHFGPSMDLSLINPNQIRHFGIPVLDNPHDRSKQLGIDHEQVFIPFLTKGSAVYFETHMPSDEDLESYPHVVLTDNETMWDPMGVKMAGDQPYGDNDKVVVQQVKRENNKQRRATHYDCESDLVLGSISESLVPDLLYERLVASVRVRRRTRKNERKQTTHKRTSDIKKVKAMDKHSKITPESIASMMNIGLDKAKQMLTTRHKGI